MVFIYLIVIKCSSHKTSHYIPASYQSQHALFLPPNYSHLSLYQLPTLFIHLPTLFLFANFSPATYNAWPFAHIHTHRMRNGDNLTPHLPSAILDSGHNGVRSPGLSPIPSEIAREISGDSKL